MRAMMKAAGDMPGRRCGSCGLGIFVLGMLVALPVSAADTSLARRAFAPPAASNAPPVADAAAGTNGATCRVIPDNAYDGTLGSMACVDVPGIDRPIEKVKLYLALRHGFVGDLTVKVASPLNRVVTVLSRPGFVESADDGGECCGSASGVTAASPLVFEDVSTGPSAEAMGRSLRDSQVVCRDDGQCSFQPDSGAAVAGKFDAFRDESGAGTWKVCVGDSENLQAGALCSAVLAFNGLESDLAVAADLPSGAHRDAPYTVRVTVSNRGPSVQTGVVVRTALAAGMTYVSDDCAAVADAAGWTWNAGTLGIDAQASCNVTVRMTQAGTCPAVSATAAVAGDIADPDPTNDIATAQNGNANVVADAGLEASAPVGGGAWTSTSTNFGHVFCAVGRCTDNPGLASYDGDWWAWFGGIDPAFPGDAAFPETGSLAQTLTIPAGASTLAFRLRMPVCSANAADYLALRIDGVERWRVDATNAALCGGTTYTRQTVDVAALADGARHAVEFRGVQNGQGGASSFFVDNVELVAPPTCDASNERVFGDDFDVTTP